MPANIKYGNTHGVCEDSQGRIYVHHTVNDASESHDSMVVFDAKGKFVKSWGKEFQGGAHGLHIRKEGSQEFLYLCDTKRAIVVKTTLEGEEVFTLGYPKESEFYKVDKDGKPLTKYSPTNLAIAPNGDIYVGDGYGSSYINQYNSKGEFIRTFGGKGKEPGQLDCPHGITVDLRGPSPLLLVADRANARLQYFTLEGKHVSFVGGTNLPCHFSERHGEFVIPDLGARVTLMDRENQVITHLGDDSAAKTWQDLRKQTRDHFIARQVRLSARRLLRSRGQHLRGRVGRGGARQQAAQSRLKIADIKTVVVNAQMRNWVFVKVETDTPGLEGWGEASMEWKTRAVAAAVDDLKPFILGDDPTRIEHLYQKLYRQPFFRPGVIGLSAISGIEQACWDILGKHLGVPVYKLLGGAVRDKVRMYTHLGGGEMSAVYESFDAASA